MQRIYVAGKYEDSCITNIQSNMRRGFKLALQVLNAGFAPFIPWLDFPLGWFQHIERETYLKSSMAWLEVCDAVLVVLVGEKTSAGTQAEIARAEELGIPVFYSLNAMEAYFRLMDTDMPARKQTDERSWSKT